ncbi:MAG: divalent-cation tolerance protein CutA [Pseudomonadota bacterium]|nr:divalent-cation tolerance protein CutA [Pseudomonadota bacterium]
MSGIASIYATFASDEEARRIGRVLVEERLAACVNILGQCHSIYRWQGRIEEASEVAAIFKVAADQAELALKRIAELHSYDVPAAVIWPIADALGDYARWVAAEVPDKASGTL